MESRNINVDLFRRFSPEHKKEMVNALTEDQLLHISLATATRIVKEVGKGGYNEKRSHNKDFRFENEGNSWNSTVESIGIYKKVPIVCTYIQGDDTDGYDEVTLAMFLSPNYNEVECAKLHESFNNGYEHTVKANYDKSDRAEVIRCFLLAYIEAKYAKKA